MKAIRETIENLVRGKHSVRSFQEVYRVDRNSRVKYWFWGILLFFIVLLFLPWTQNIQARGKVTTLRQEQRPQQVNTIIGGRIIKWYVREGNFVRKGDTLVQLAEIKDDYLDPQLILRTDEQLSAKQTTVESYRSKASTIDIQLGALQKARDLKIMELGNKVLQQRQRIQSDSMELLAVLNDFSIKSEQYKRQVKLYDSGLVSLVQLEQRNQAFQQAIANKTAQEIKLFNSKQELIRLQLELNGEQQQYLEKISKAEGDRYQVFSQIATGEGEVAKLKNLKENYAIRNGQYFILAPQDGQLINARKQGINEIVKEGESLVEIVPKEQQLAVEIFVNPMDMPLLDTGQDVRFLFDGFPALVFSGWPEASYGIFSGKTIAVENALNENGKFRILVVENSAAKKWPRELRNGTGAFAIALLKDVPVWYELWRNINGFPPEYYRTAASPTKKKAGL